MAFPIINSQGKMNKWTNTPHWTCAGFYTAPNSLFFFNSPWPKHFSQFPYLPQNFFFFLRLCLQRMFQQASAKHRVGLWYITPFHDLPFSSATFIVVLLAVLSHRRNIVNEEKGAAIPGRPCKCVLSAEAALSLCYHGIHLCNQVWDVRLIIRADGTDS